MFSSAPPCSTFCSWFAEIGRFWPVLIQEEMMLPRPFSSNIFCRPAMPPTCGLLMSLIIILKAPACCCDCAVLPIPAIPRTSSSRPMVASYLPRLAYLGAENPAGGIAEYPRKPPAFESGRYNLLLLRNHQARDLLVRGLGQDLLGDQVGLLCIGAAVDDLLGIGIADARQRLQLIERGGVDVHSFFGFFRFARLGRFTGGLRQRTRDGQRHAKYRD